MRIRNLGGLKYAEEDEEALSYQKRFYEDQIICINEKQMEDFSRFLGLTPEQKLEFTNKKISIMKMAALIPVPPEKYKAFEIALWNANISLYRVDYHDLVYVANWPKPDYLKLIGTYVGIGVFITLVLVLLTAIIFAAITTGGASIAVPIFVGAAAWVVGGATTTAALVAGFAILTAGAIAAFTAIAAITHQGIIACMKWVHHKMQARFPAVVDTSEAFKISETSTMAVVMKVFGSCSFDGSCAADAAFVVDRDVGGERIPNSNGNVNTNLKDYVISASGSPKMYKRASNCDLSTKTSHQKENLTFSMT